MPRLLLALLLLLPLAAGCDSGSSEDPPASTAGTYVGTYVGGGSGALSVTVDGQTATGAISPAARRALPELTGSYDPASGALSLSGGGYTLTGTIADGVLNGTWTGPAGATGAFTALLEGEGATIAVYCGTFQTQREAGTFNLVRHDADLQGFAVSEDGTALGLSGEVDGADVSFWPTGRPDQRGVATGTFRNSERMIVGTINDPENPGTFSAETCTP